jgi:DNA (cytosine-5)-methyltransferase 1
MIKIASLFCGCGGLDQGLLGGFKLPYHKPKSFPRHNTQVVWANDYDLNATKSYRVNFGDHVVCGDIVAIMDEVEAALIRRKKSPKLKAVPLPHNFPEPGSVDVVTGGFPCQPFSLAGQRKGLDDRRGKLYMAMCRAIKVLKPKAFIAENVKGLMSIDGGSVLDLIVSDLGKLGYNVSAKLYKAYEWGVPQTRERIIIVGTLKSEPKFIHPAPPVQPIVSITRAISDLEKLSEGEVDMHFWSKAKKNIGQGNSVCKPDKPGPTMRAEHHGNIEFHYKLKRRLSAREAARIQSFPDSFRYVPSASSAYKQIGNAVPPILGWHIGNALFSQLSSSNALARITYERK